MKKVESWVSQLEVQRVYLSVQLWVQMMGKMWDVLMVCPMDDSKDDYWVCLLAWKKVKKLVYLWVDLWEIHLALK